MARGVQGSTCAHPRSAKRKYVSPRGRVEWRCRICHNLNCQARRALKRGHRGKKYSKHYDVHIFVELRRPWLPLPLEEIIHDKSRIVAFRK